MTEKDRKKVIKGLEMCLMDYHGHCPYDDEECCSTKLMRDALDLLKESEAKCLTKDELSGLKEQQFVWLEGKPNLLYCFRIIGIITGKDGVTDIQFDTLESYIEQSTEFYGTHYRIWTAEPTNEQRDEMSWVQS